MGLRELPSGNYNYRKMVDGKSISITFDHKPTQKEIIYAVNEKLNAEVNAVTAPNKTFRECGAKYLELKSNILSASTKRGYESILRVMDDSFASLTISEITNTILQGYVNELACRLSPKTVSNYYGFIVAVLKTFDPNFHMNIALPKPKKKDPDEEYIPTREEVNAIINDSIEKYQLMFWLACYGLRRSEALALTMDDIKRDSIRVNKAYVEGPNREWVVQEYNKTFESNRVVPIDPSLKLRERFLKQGFIFDGHPGMIYKYLQRKQKKLGIHQFKLHALRAYFATELSHAGFESKDIQAVGGWASDHVLKKVYERDRIRKDKELRNKAALAISNSNGK